EAHVARLIAAGDEDGIGTLQCRENLRIVGSLAVVEDESLHRLDAPDFVEELLADLAALRGAQDHHVAVPCALHEPVQRVEVAVAAAHQQQAGADLARGVGGGVAQHVVTGLGSGGAAGQQQAEHRGEQERACASLHRGRVLEWVNRTKTSVGAFSPSFPAPVIRYGGRMGTALDNWFVEEILVHEDALLRYLRRHWPRHDEVHDLRQELYVRVYEAAARSLPAQPKAFLFASARHLMVDRLRRGRVVSIEPMGDFEPSSVLVDEVSPERWTGGRQALMRLADAFDRLPDRCREVVWLRRVEELSQK